MSLVFRSLKPVYLTILAICVCFSFMPTPAYAVSSTEKKAEADAVRSQLISFQTELEEASENYERAQAELQAAQEGMAEAHAKIEETNKKIETIQERLSTRARDMYMSGSLNPIDFLLGSTSFVDFATNWDILGRMNTQDADLIYESKTLKKELEDAHAEYSAQEKAAAEKTKEAADIEAEVEAKVQQATELVSSLDAEAQALLAEEQAAEAARVAASRNPSDFGYSENVAPVPSYGSVVDYAMSRIGCPYVFGAGGPNSFDCSGLVSWAYAQVGKYLPHQSEALYAAATNIVPVSEARPGDVLWRYGHVGIAVSYGGSHYVHAPTFGGLVRDTDPLSWSGFTCALQFS